MRWLKKHKFSILAFFVPCFLLSLFFWWKGCFTDKNILNSDMNSQYLPLFQYLKDFLHGGSTFPYSFAKGLGGGMYGTFFYYLSNPLNLLVYFFEDIPLFFLLLVIFKLSLAGFTVSIFMKYHFKKENFSLFLFCMAYVFMGYNINYYVNIMWLDGVILAPIILVAIDKILDKKKSYLYIMLLFIAIFTNYYMGYILTVFSIIYFLYRFFLRYGKRRKEERKMVLHFLLITFLTGMSTMFILLPCALEILSVSRIFSISQLKLININFLDLVASNYIGFGNLKNPVNFYGFHFFAGTMMIPLIICYFTNTYISKREKIATALVYAIFVLPIIFPIFNVLWHMFTLPTAFNYRYSFLATLFTLYVGYQSLQHLEGSKKALIFYYLLFLILSVSLGYSTMHTPEYYFYLNVYKIIATILLLGMSIFLIIQRKKRPLLFFMAFELLMNVLWIGLDSKMPSDFMYWNTKQKLGEFANRCSDNQRCEVGNDYTLNPSFFSNYHGVSTFLSTTNTNPIQFLSRASDYTSTRNYYHYQPDMILDMLLGVEWIQDEGIINGYKMIEEVSIDKDYYYTMRNPYALGLGYLVSPQIKNFQSSNSGIFYLEDLLNCLSTEKRNYLEVLPLEKKDDRHYTLKVFSNYPYLYIYTDVTPFMNGKEILKYLSIGDHYGVIYTPSEDIVEFSFSEVPQEFSVYTVNLKELQKFKEERKTFKITENKGNKIKGNVDTSEEGTLLFTIPYEKGWKANLDGEEVEIYPLLDTFMGIDIQPGNHEVILQYHVEGLEWGIVISLVSLLLLMIVEKWLTV